MVDMLEKIPRGNIKR